MRCSRRRAAARSVYSYGYVFNGFAAELTDAQAASSDDEGRALGREGRGHARRHFVRRQPSSASTGAGRPLGQLGGTASAGENVIIGIVDSGVWPESLSFSDRTGANGNATKDGKLAYQQIPGWHGKCTPGERFNASNCNQKLIGARYFNAGWGGNAEHRPRSVPWEFKSPRDYDGHGTHTVVDRGRQPRTSPRPGPARAFGNDQRHRAARAHRDLQGCGRRRTTATASGFPPTSSRRSTRPSPTAST